MLLKRIVSGILLGGFILYVVLFSGSNIFKGVVAAFCLISLYELVAMQHKDNLKYIFAATLFGCSYLIYNIIPFDLLIQVAVLGYILAFLSIGFYPGVAIKFWQQKIVLVLFFLFWVSSFAGTLISFSGANARISLISVLCICFATDIGAYFSGNLFGKRKLCPSISPKKTVAGLVGGMVFALFTSLIIHNYYLGGVSYVTYIVTIVISLVAVLGDLYMSMIKRINNIKDSGVLIPGHGGVLDRVDSAMPCVIVFYFLKTLMVIS